MFFSEAEGPWYIFLCDSTRPGDAHPMCVGITPDEYETCPGCGAALRAVLVDAIPEAKA